MPARTLHDPDAILDYTQTWADQLTEWGGDTITDATATVTHGTATVGTVTWDATSVSFWLSAATVGTVAVTVHVTTAGGREDDRTSTFQITER